MSQSHRHGTDLIASSHVQGRGGLGVLGSEIPSTGANGPAYMYNDITLPGDANNEYRGLILTVPSAGAFFAYEDSSFSFIGAPSGVYTFTYRLFENGVDLGTATGTISVGVQLLIPSSDVSAGAWAPSTGTSLAAMLDEAAASDVDYDSTTTVSSSFEVALSVGGDPLVSTGHIVRYRIDQPMTVALMQGATTIASWSQSPTVLTTYEQTLTGAQADAITNYSALSLKFTSN